MAASFLRVACYIRLDLYFGKHALGLSNGWSDCATHWQIIYACRPGQFCIVCLGVLWLHGSAWAAARDSFITSSLSASFFATEGDFDPGKTFGNDGYLRVYEALQSAICI